MEYYERENYGKYLEDDTDDETDKNKQNRKSTENRIWKRLALSWKTNADPKDIIIHDTLSSSYVACPGAHGQTTDRAEKVKNCD